MKTNKKRFNHVIWISFRRPLQPSPLLGFFVIWVVILWQTHDVRFSSTGNTWSEDQTWPLDNLNLALKILN